jgi:hypothetical protein
MYTRKQVEKPRRRLPKVHSSSTKSEGFRRTIAVDLGIDSRHNGGAGTLRGLPFWNVDLSVKKDVMVTERYHVEFSSIFTNVFNHNQLFDPGNPGLVLGEPDISPLLGEMRDEIDYNEFCRRGQKQQKSSEACAGMPDTGHGAKQSPIV